MTMKGTSGLAKSGEITSLPIPAVVPGNASASVSVSLVVRLFASQNLLLAGLRKGLGERSLARFDLLAQLLREDGQNLAKLSRRLLVTAGNLTGLVDRAERDGVVERRGDPADRRRVQIYLTHAGRKMAKSNISRHNQVVEELLAELDEAERANLRNLLGKLRTQLETKLERPRVSNRTDKTSLPTTTAAPKIAPKITSEMSLPR